MATNTGQSNLTNKVFNELEFPNIVIEKELDWENKLGVVYTTQQWMNVNWNDVISSIAVKYRCAKIIVSGDALNLLRKNYTPLLPPYFDILENSTVAEYPLWASSVLYITISTFDDISLGTVAKMEFLYSSEINESGEAHDYIFTLTRTPVNNKNNDKIRWVSNKAIDIFKFSNANPKYNTITLNYFPRVGDILEIEFVIDSLPLLNPTTRNKKFSVVTKGVVDYLNESNPSGGFGIIADFSYFHYGKDLSTNDDYRLIYNGKLECWITFAFDGNKHTLDINDDKLWIEINRKRSLDIGYEKSHREESIGNKFCYIKSIRLLP